MIEIFLIKYSVGSKIRFLLIVFQISHDLIWIEIVSISISIAEQLSIEVSMIWERFRCRSLKGADTNPMWSCLDIIFLFYLLIRCRHRWPWYLILVKELFGVSLIKQVLNGYSLEEKVVLEKQHAGLFDLFFVYF